MEARLVVEFRALLSRAWYHLRSGPIAEKNLPPEINRIPSSNKEKLQR